MVEHKIKYQSKVIAYWVKRNKGISYIQVKINREGVIVTAPKSVPHSTIKKFVLSKADQILKVLEQMAPVVKNFVDGEVFQYLGKDRVLRINEKQGARGLRVEMTPRRILVAVPRGMSTAQVKSALIAWYREEARVVLSNKVYSYARKMRLKPGRISIRDQKTKWGSCSSTGNLSFSWRLVMMPEDMIDYVVVHELSHIRHKNHGKDFWALVGSFIPDYKERKDWFKQNGWKFKW